MKGRDRAIVAVILALALIAGLFTVSRALQRAQSAQAQALAAAQTNVAGETAVGDISAPGSAAASAEQESPVPGDESGAAGVSGAGTASDVGPHDLEGGAAGADGSAAGENTQESGTSSADAPVAQTGQQSVTLPAMGGGSFSLQELTVWMQTQSAAAQAALQARDAAAALAVSGESASLRSFARSQGLLNFEAEQNRLGEEANTLGLAYLRCRDTVALQEENVAFYESLTQASPASDTSVAAVSSGDLVPSAEEAAASSTQPSDQTTAPPVWQTALDSAKLSLESARADLSAAMRDINRAVGNAPETQLVITDQLTEGDIPVVTADSAVAQALDSRNEVKGAAYTVTRERAALVQLRYTYPTTAPEYQKQQAVVDAAQSALLKTRGAVESDVRNRSAQLSISAQRLALLRQTLEASGLKPPESGTVEEQTAQWVTIYANRLQQLLELAQLNSDLLAFQNALSAGTVSVEIA